MVILHRNGAFRVKLTRLDKLILILPFFGFLDLISTFYAEYRGYSLGKYEVGFLASYFFKAGSLYYYIPLYFLILFGMAAGMLYIRSKLALSSSWPDKIVFLLLVMSVGIIEAKLVGTAVSNVLLTTATRTELRDFGKTMAYLVIILVVLWSAKNEIISRKELPRQTEVASDKV